ncbi:fimbrillin family protein [uncultured Prevotella sp.]|uniref:fimbrillin family protein n=1 Tax=uncultured Prevotella sp. TaxID=159272 RepID=UPI002611BE5D|nr:fimbrillin family protein [uncultured Prevotella sp.]
MKKMLFCAITAAAMLSACSSEENISSNPAGEALTPKIQLGVSTAATTTTRGTGTVGGITPEENVWAGQDLWIYMLKHGSMEVAEYVDPDPTAIPNKTPIFNNKKFTAPVGAGEDEENKNKGIASTADGSVCYYPINGQSDFWGYRVDDACGGDPVDKTVNDEGVVVEAKDATRRVVDITIDGSQDIMAGKAEITEEEKAKLGNRTNDYFSAYAARKGVQPNINFEHLLTRLTFHVKAGSKSAAGNGTNTDPVNVKSIAIEGRNKGQLIVAYKGVQPDSLLSFEDAKIDFYLMKREGEDHNSALKPLTDIPLTWTTTPENAEGAADNIAIGEALLVAPGVAKYKLKVGLSQMVQKKVGEEKQPMKLEYEADILAPNGKFEPGKSYDVNITVYGLEKIEVTATLKPWVEGGSIDIDDDNRPQE